MTTALDDTGQPTVDRLAALEAVAKASRKLMDERKDGSATLILNMAALVEALAALDTASPLTTPTPDKAALERARRLANRLAKHFIGEQFAAEDETCSRCVAMVTDALAAAEAKARAAERERCEQIVQNYIDRPTSGPKNNTLSAFEQGMDHMAGCIDNASAILDAIRALATPAPEEKL